MVLPSLHDIEAAAQIVYRAMPARDVACAPIGLGSGACAAIAQVLADAP